VSIDMAAARRHGVTVCGTEGGASGATAELTWALILALLRHIPQEDAAVRSGGWQHTVGLDLAGSTLAFWVWVGWAPGSRGSGWRSI